MALARRAQFGMAFAETNEPGIEMNPDGSMEVIAVDGSRSALSGGGPSFPAEWTVSANGSLTIAPEDGDAEYGSALVLVNSANGPLSYFLVAKDVLGGKEMLTLDWHGEFAVSGEDHEGPTLLVDSVGQTTLSGERTVLRLESAAASADIDEVFTLSNGSTAALFSIWSDGSARYHLYETTSVFSLATGSGTSFSVDYYGLTLIEPHGAGDALTVDTTSAGDVAGVALTLRTPAVGSSGLLTAQVGDEYPFAIGASGATFLTAIDGSITPLDITLHPSQSQDAFVVRDSDGINIFGVNKGGYFYTRRTDAPADGDLVAGQLMLWFDQTNGSPKLMVKAKRASGTVVTGSVDLSP